MKKARFFLLLLLLSLFLNAKFLFNDHLISPKAADYIEKMGSELFQKTAINAYLITSHDTLQRGVSVNEFLQRYESNLSKPYVAIVFLPNSKRIHVVASSKELLNALDKDKILDYAIKIIASKDSNSLQSKYDVGLVQAYSELADEVAAFKGVTLESTIKEEGKWFINFLNIIILIGSLIVIWIFFVSPILHKRLQSE
jgi:hypothetical protein